MPNDAGKLNLVWELPHAPEKVWRALTDPHLVAQWLMKTDMPAVRGQAFTFRMDPMPYWDGIVHSEILEMEPQKRLRYSWKGGPGTSPLDTVVTWTLIPMKGGTRLELEHSGFKPENDQAFAGSKQGWERNVGTNMTAVLKALN